MLEKYLYFGNKTARSLALTESESSVQTYTLTTGLVDPIPDGVANTNTIFANGTLTAELQNLHLDGSGDQHVVGSHYTTNAVDDGKLMIHPNALSYDGTNLVTVKTVAQDPVYGVTNSSTVGENDITFVLEKPVLAGDANVWPASAFLGVEMVDNDTADIYFAPQTGDGLGNGADKVRVSYTAGNFKALGDMLHSIINDNRYQAGMVVVADEWTGVYAENNKVGITAVDSITLDS
tara:strand:- start:36 stop:740 length:705 start_codon:yes stop_codon:yes gene_type:complete